MPINDVQKTNRQHAVPQNIMDVEFKIIGDLTMRQFFYLLVFGGIAYVVFTAYGGFLKWPLVFGCVLAGLAFAFIPIEERNLDVWIVNGFRAVYKNTQYVWRKTPEIPPAFSFENINVVKQEIITLTPTSSRRKLEEFLESQGKVKEEDPLDIPEVTYMKKVRSAFQYAGRAIDVDAEADIPAVYPPYIPPDLQEDSQEQEMPTFSAPTPPPTSEPTTEPEADEYVEYAPKYVEEPYVPPIQPQPEQLPEVQPPAQPEPPPFVYEPLPEPIEEPEPVVEQKYIPLPPQPPVEEPRIEEPQYKPEPAQKPQPQEIIGSAPITEKPEKEHEDIIEPASVISRPIKLPKLPHIPKPLLPTQEELQDEPSSNVDFLTPLTPDQHSGRRFTSLLPKQGEIILPIRGETVIQTSDQAEIEEDIQEKAEQLRKLLVHIRESENIPHTPIETTVKEATMDMKPGEQREKQFSMQEMLEEMEKNRQRAREEAQQAPIPLPTTNSTITQTQPSPVSNIPANRTDEMPDFSATPNTDKESKEVSAKEWLKMQQTGPQAVTPTYAKIKPLNTIPNIVSGIVLGPGEEKLQNIVLIIKNSKDEPVRALKSNALGQFSISTPLANGTYYMETDKSNRTGYTFDIIKIDAKGEFIPPIEVKGK